MSEGIRPVRTALVSVSDKNGLVPFVAGLVEAGAKILSTGGTARALREAGIDVVDVSEHTGSPEILDGRVKTLHPKVHGGILARRDDADHDRQIAEHSIEPIDLVCVNLYPFAAVVAKGCDDDEAIENIDIGGPSMLRSAAKNHAGVCVVTDPDDYDVVLSEVRDAGGTTLATRRRLALAAFRATAAYDGMIADELGRRSRAADGADDGFSSSLHQNWALVGPLRYGENPHQRAAFYRSPDIVGPSIAAADVLQGKALSYNNIVDADAALQLALEFDDPVCAAIKHTNPCGVATAPTSAEAFDKARRSDPVSIFGGIVAFNRTLDEDTARALTDVFLEIVIAPAYEEAALEVFRAAPKFKNVRVLRVANMDRAIEPWETRRVLGGALLQARDVGTGEFAGAKVATERAPSDDERSAMQFAWKVAKHVKSNAIVLAGRDHVVGVGAGQMSRVDSARIAVLRAREHDMDTRGSVVASDAFFPFRDGLDVCAEAGATAVVQPGGSMRDDEVVAAANEHGMAMLMTGARHFRH